MHPNTFVEYQHRQQREGVTFPGTVIATLAAMAVVALLAVLWTPVNAAGAKKAPAQKATQAEAAPLVYSTDELKVTLYDRPCTAKAVKDQIEDEALKQYRAGVVMWKGNTLQACWRDVPSSLSRGGEVVFIVSDDGDAGVLPKQLFKADPGV